MSRTSNVVTVHMDAEGEDVLMASVFFDISSTPEGASGGAPDGAPVVPAPGQARVQAAISAASRWLIARQDPAGWWCGELEGDTTLESYMILLEAFFGRPSSRKVEGLARVIRDEALPDGGFSQYLGGPADLSVSCLSYLALKIAGDDADAPHMQRTRALILGQGGLERANTYTKFHFALFGQYPWERLPAIPPEMVFLPARSPFTVYDMSSWSRTIFVPLAIVAATKPVCALPPGRGAGELAAGDGAPAGAGGVTRSDPWTLLFSGIDRVLKAWERVPGAGRLRRAAVRRAEAWMIERLGDSDGLGAILPAMANTVLALGCLGYGQDHPLLARNLRHLDGLVLRDEAGALRMQPCLSPVWDTVLASYALSQAGGGADDPVLRQAATWLLSKQTQRPGDWSRRNPAAPGGWYFEGRNELYPDVDDTSVALMVLRRARADAPVATQEAAIARGLAWMLGMQNSDGGWGSFDRDNDKRWLTRVPFADHNAMIDPSTADISGRVLESLSHFPEFGPSHPAVARALEFLRRDQTADGAWYGRWGVNYIYGTWQVLRGLVCIGEDMRAPYVRRAVRWLLNHQNRDGGWGESIASYDDPSRKGLGTSTPSQTAWALMGLLATSDPGDQAIRRGVRWLLERQDGDGTWEQAEWTGTGFPKVFYLNYHYYRHYFPLMALAQYDRARFGRR
jgi:squalene-hopene/tetraprenyl-beta-curcumene cyclase